MTARFAVVTVAGLAAVATALLTSLAGCSAGGSSPPRPPGSPASSTAASAPVTGTASGTAAAGTGTGTAASGTNPTAGPGPGSEIPIAPGAAGLVPLWPFTTLAQVQEWQSAFRSGGHQPWHLDVAQTALGFTRGRLGYTDVDRATTVSVRGGDARVGVGWNDPESAGHSVAVLHLVRFGTGPDAPWVVVGSDDTQLTLDRPTYGSTVTGTLTVGGVISGVDESLRVIVLEAASTKPLATSPALSAGGVRTPWSTTLHVSAPSGTVLTIAVSTGGHLRTVERFAITAVRLG